MDEKPRPIRPSALGDARAPVPPAADLEAIPLAPDDGPAPPPRPVPVRPRIPATATETGPTTTRRDGPRASRDATPRRTPPRVSEEARRCGNCGYDLRGDPRARTCPECGAAAPPPPAADAMPPEPAVLRERIVGMWQSLGHSAAAVVVLLSPLPYFGAFGFVLTSCVGFAIGFRALALRGLEAVPKRAAPAITPAVARFQTALLHESIVAGAFVLYALLLTVGLPIVPLALGRTILVIAWTVLAVRTLLAQLALARAFLTATRADDTVDPQDFARTTALLLGGAGLAIGAVLGSVTASVLEGVANAMLVSFGRAVGWIAFVALFVAPVLAAIAVLRMRALSTIVGEAVFECTWFRRKRFRREGEDEADDADEDDEDPDDDWDDDWDDDLDGDRDGDGNDRGSGGGHTPRHPGPSRGSPRASPFVPPDDDPIPLA
ncbi:MAG: hypothetical protein RI967_2160 [Planctomycetota bacterium]